MTTTRRKLYIIGAIEWDTYLAFSESLDILERENKKPIEVELASDGGDAHAALAFSDRIRTSDCEINITGTGYIASAAVLVLASGDYRKLTSNSWVMVHQEYGTEDFPSAKYRYKESTQGLALEQQWAALLAAKTLASKEYWYKLHEDTTHLSAQSCFDLGLVDELI